MTESRNHERMKARNIDVVILCGGLGKRLREVVSDRPKSMAEINQRPFLDILIEYMAGYGFKRFILCIGYMADVIKHYYQNKKGPLEILFSEEKEPLGTGGAIKNAESLIQSNPFLVMNGDSICEVEFDRFIESHFAKKALVAIALALADETGDYGSVVVDSSGRIIRFDEKLGNKGGFVNTGMYLFEKEVLSLIPPNRNYSLEYHLFPMIIGKEVYGYTTKEGFIDIGTPQRYERARQILTKLEQRKGQQDD